jgi:hypothetical protein
MYPLVAASFRQKRLLSAKIADIFLVSPLISMHIPETAVLSTSA